ncbi:helix-hairpin-helix domain-containing protein [Fulvivirgaceae bacterium BMA10]|uniref:Helix-hairpin-helix domain-containing protein n=1 Tax=Splendidivirga corallicola TaxID=3051826 RepID=A0ABT8KPE9_9BACT|nr:helix-hairpin-helix domain-containing protein [Fulvivirgaceae bacterium BMA10]
MLFILLFSLIYTLTNCAKSQNIKEVDLDKILQEILPNDEDIPDYEALLELFHELHNNPLNLNKVDKSDIQSLRILSQSQIQSFFRHITKNGNLLSIYELQAIPGFDHHTIQKLLPFVEVAQPTLGDISRSLIKRILHEKNNYLMFRYSRTLETLSGSSNSSNDSLEQSNTSFLGTPEKIYVKFNVSRRKDFSLGFTMEKDIGEQISFNRSNHQYGFDFNSFHFALYNKNKLKSLIIGDYQLQIGQSLLLGSTFGFGKGSETITTIKRNHTGIRPYTSSTETGFFRGAAFSLVYSPITMTLFYSNQLVDGVINSSESSEFNGYPASSILKTGLHRTLKELKSKNSIQEHVCGSNVYFESNTKSFRLGATMIFTKYNAFLHKAYNLYNQYEFRGTENFNTGMHLTYNWQNFQFFMEGAISKSGGKGLIVGTVGSLSNEFQISLLYRNYDRHFHSFFGNAFGENSRNINENGTYLGIKFTPSRKITVSAYFDLFKFPWLKFNADAPSRGNEQLIRATYEPGRNMSFSFQFRQEDKYRNIRKDNELLNRLEKGIKRNFHAAIDFDVNQILNLKSRIQSSSFTIIGQTTSGYAISQDVNFTIGKLRINTRYALFDTDDFNNRQYMYERDVLYAFSFPFYHGSGIRKYLMFQYKFNKHLSGWIRFSQTTFTNQETIGSGLNKINGPKKRDIKVQVRYKF